MNFIAQDCNDNRIYLVTAKDMEAAVALLGEIKKTNGDEFSILPFTADMWPKDGEAIVLN